MCTYIILCIRLLLYPSKLASDIFEFHQALRQPAFRGADDTILLVTKVERFYPEARHTRPPSCKYDSCAPKGPVRALDASRKNHAMWTTVARSLSQMAVTAY